MPRRVSWATVVALLLAAVFVAAMLSVIDYPLGAAWDESVNLLVSARAAIAITILWA